MVSKYAMKNLSLLHLSLSICLSVSLSFSVIFSFIYFFHVLSSSTASHHNESNVFRLDQERLSSSINESQNLTHFGNYRDIFCLTLVVILQSTKFLCHPNAVWNRFFGQRFSYKTIETIFRKTNYWNTIKLRTNLDYLGMVWKSSYVCVELKCKYYIICLVHILKV